jgi:superfamily II DNA or RNA helicase
MTQSVPGWQFDAAVEAEADGYASVDELAVLEADRTSWRAALTRLITDAEIFVASAQALQGDERAQVLADAQDELRKFKDARQRVFGVEPSEQRSPRASSAPTEPTEPETPQPVRLQVSWRRGRVVAWAGGRGNPPAPAEAVRQLLETAGAPAASWLEHEPVALPGGDKADALGAPIGETLGWLVAAGAGQVGDVAASVTWLGRVAIWAVELTARGAVVPQLRRSRRSTTTSKNAKAQFAVRWAPALVDPQRLEALAGTMPGSVAALEPGAEGRAFTRSALQGMVHAICRGGAERVDVAAAPPTVRGPADVRDAFLARLDGTTFDAPTRIAGEYVDSIAEWARSVTGEAPALVVRVDPPDQGNAWNLAVFAPARQGSLVPIEQAIANGGAKRRELEDALTRAERILPALLRPGGTRRGQVVLSQDEAWDIMTRTGPRLAAAGFDVRVPELSRHRPTATLRVFAEERSSSVVGASQLADVRWSALFDDVELTAADIAQLSREARPLIRSGGKWIALDRADLDAAAAALAERASTTQLTGADMLRLALGLESSPLAGGFSVEGSSWAADVLAAARAASQHTATASDGFSGVLRSYQAEALTWLGFLDAAGIGGCLALDMGLGKTPTMLAHVVAGAGAGPALVIAPAAVVGNWAAEAAKFTPGLRVVVHHGASRASAEEIADEVAAADVIITTYGTAVRDVDALAAVDWRVVVADEAQAIKNPASDTAQQLRRIPAKSRIALTGTPIENGLGDLWAILDFTNPGLVGPRPQFVAALSQEGDTVRAAEDALRALNGILVFRRTKAEPLIAAELPDRIDELDHCAMTAEQIGLYQAVLDKLVVPAGSSDGEKPGNGQILAAITALKQICNHPAAYVDDDRPLDGRSGKLARLEEIVEAVFAAGERVLVFTHFAEWGRKLAAYLSETTGTTVECYHGGLTRGVRDRMIHDFQHGEGPGALVLSLKAGGTGLNLTAANHVVLYDRWWNPAVEDQARDRAWRIGQTHTVISHRLVCPGTIDERVEEVVAGKRRIADLVLPKSSSLADLDADELRQALGIRPDQMLTEDDLQDAVA